MPGLVADVKRQPRMPAAACTGTSGNRNDTDESDRRVVAHLREYGTVSNQMVQNLLLVDGQRARVILRSLAE